MNVHDEARNLAKVLKESEEYKSYKELKETASKNPELVEMLNDFQAKQFEIQSKQMIGEEISEDMKGQMQSLYEIIMKDPLAAQYMQAEMRFSMLINDIYTILGEVIKVE
ncbi:YlbF family regulator [Anaerovorax odorimutans]|uniref:YlbF family regulator n=1 Tax=Anaerovorax odorimutans TaxID=109327 RepID=UPI00041EC08F|nr:YlbF family regulator [Anaerovorax odorimutans]